MQSSAEATRLKALREEQFMSQADLATASGVGRATIARIETGRQTPHGRTVRKLAGALGVTPKTLVPNPAAVAFKRRPRGG